MKKERNPRPPRKMKPVLLVFCEGETEEAYVYFLRKQSSQVPIRIIPRITGLSISQDYINRIKRNVKLDNSDKITSFLMYDLDRNDVAVKIETCKDSVNISSNPCIELWFLLHSNEQNAAITTGACVEKLERSTPDWTNYKKGTLQERQKMYLWENRSMASGRAKKLPEGENPSSMVYRLLETIENMKNESDS